MLRPLVEERLSPLELLTRSAPRRRRPLVEDQPARCPRCEGVMILYVGRRGPRYHCACDEAGSR